MPDDTDRNRTLTLACSIESVGPLVPELRRIHSMDADIVSTLAASGESEMLEFKRSTGQRTDVAKTVCAMLNNRGGKVLIGVEPDGSVIGQDVGDQTHRATRAGAETTSILLPSPASSA
jgi:hypothetical protein